jgi:hypothetical protein
MNTTKQAEKVIIAGLRSRIDGILEAAQTAQEFLEKSKFSLVGNVMQDIYHDAETAMEQADELAGI